MNNPKTRGDASTTLDRHGGGNPPDDTPRMVGKVLR